VSLARTLRHLATPPLVAHLRFPAATLDAIEAAIRAGEATHTGQVCFAVEAALDAHDLWRGTSPRERAIHVFGELRVWDTHANNGVLIFVLLAERNVELIADRGAAAAVPAEAWEQVCRAMEASFRAGRFEEGAVAGVNAVSALLARHFPATGGQRSPNELRDRPVVR
jgi:hypothetical protein